MERREASWATTAAVRRSMRANRSRDTAPELAVRRAAHALGLRYRVAARPIATLRRTADLVFPGERVAVFVDGCYWHGCPEHFKPPASNKDYWVPKIERNRLRDVETTQALMEAGWTVLRFWEHEDPTGCAIVIGAVVRERRGGARERSPRSSWVS